MNSTQYIQVNRNFHDQFVNSYYTTSSIDAPPRFVLCVYEDLYTGVHVAATGYIAEVMQRNWKNFLELF